MNDISTDLLIAILEEKANLSEVEKSVLNSCYELKKEDNRDGLIRQIIENRKLEIWYKENFLAVIQTQGQSQSVPLTMLSTDDLKSNLYNQIIILLNEMTYKK